MIEFNNWEHGKIISAAIPRPFGDIIAVISHSKDGKLLGGVTYDQYTGSMVLMHQASFSKYWISRDMLWSAFHYPFEQMKVKKIVGPIPSSNPKLLEFNAKIGFKIEAIIKDGYPNGVDMLLMSMTREDCPWLKITPRTLRANR